MTTLGIGGENIMERDKTKKWEPEVENLSMKSSWHVLKLWKSGW